MKANRDSLRKIFSCMDDAGINIFIPHNWSFFFLDKNLNSILRLEEQCKKNETLYSLDQMEDGYWRLTIYKKRVFSAEELHKQNLDYNKLVKLLDIELYDGWDMEVLS